MSDNFFDNKEQNCYELHYDGYTARLYYMLIDNGDIVLTSTMVPSPIQGRGVGSKLIESALRDIENRNMAVIPQCAFAAAYIRKHPEWNKIVER